MKRRADVRSVVLCAAVLGAGVAAGCVEKTTRTSPRAAQQRDVGNVVDRQTSGAGSKAGHGSRAPSGGALVTLPDIGEAAHRSGVVFPEQVGPFRRVRALRGPGDDRTAEYTEAGGRMRLIVALRDRAGQSVQDREAQLGAALDDDPAARPPGGGRNSFRVYTLGPDFLEYVASYPSGQTDAGERAFAQFLAEHARDGRPR